MRAVLQKRLLNLGITICQASHYEAWTRDFKFRSDYIRFGLEEYKYAAGYLKLGPAFRQQTLNFPLPNGSIEDITSLVSLCLSIDMQPRGNISLVINGHLALTAELSIINDSIIPRGNGHVKIYMDSFLWYTSF